MIQFLKPSKVPKKTNGDKFVSLPPANRRKPKQQRPLKQKPEGKKE